MTTSCSRKSGHSSHGIPLEGGSLALCCFRLPGPGSVSEWKHGTCRPQHSPAPSSQCCSLRLLGNVGQELCGELPRWQWRHVSGPGGRWQRSGAWGITYSQGGFFLFQPLSSDGKKVVGSQATPRGLGERCLEQFACEFPFKSNYRVSRAPWGHLLIGSLIRFFFVCFGF